MNKHLYRIVFNERRGQLMAVAEHASSCGKVASGCADVPMRVALLVPPVLRVVGFAVLLALGSVWFAPDSQAQVVANPNAPRNQQPTILQTANGLPQVNIQAPSAAGVSRNAYSQFDVQSNGVILNNSRTDVQTQQGGWVQANPWLASGGARVILNEVNSSNPSLLNGYVEVAGQRAAVVIANPAGISVNGGGFINASQAVLTTGTPVMNASGGIDSYRVSGGTVSVSGNGLDLSTTDYAAILARAVQVNAGIWANELKVVTGANQIDASTVAPNTTPATTAIAGTGSTSAFALDVAQIGGMYAGKIFLIGTEAGLGVNNAGVIAANSGDLVLSHNGWLSNTGTLQASGNVQVNTQGNVSNAGALQAQNGNVQINTQGGISNAGTMYAGGNTSLTATGSVNNAGTLQATSGNVQVNTQGGISNAGTMYANGNTSLMATGDVSNTGTLQAGGGDVQINTQGSATNGGTVYASGSTSLTAVGNVNNTGALQAAGGDVQLNTQGSVTNGGTVYASGSTSLTAAGNVSNTGTLQAGGNVKVNTQGSASNAGTVYAGGNTNLTATGNVNNTGILQAGGGNVQVNTQGGISNTGTVYASGNNTVTAVGGVSNSGTLAAQGNTNIQAQSLSSSASGVLAAGMQPNGQLASSGDLSVTTSGTLVANGQNLAAVNLMLNGSDVDVSNSSTAASNLGLTATSGVVRTRSATVSSLTSAGALTVTANALASQSLDNTGGHLSAGQTTLNVANLTNTGGTVAAQELTVNTDGTVTNAQGKLYASDHLSVSANVLSNDNGQISAGGNLSLTAGVLSNRAGTVYAGNDVLLAAGTLDNTGGTLSSGRDLNIQAPTWAGASAGTGYGTVNAGRDLTVNTTGSHNITTAAFNANRNLIFTTTGNVNNSGTVQASGDLSLNAANLSNSGNLLSNGTLAVTATDAAGTINNSGSMVGASVNLTAPASITNTGPNAFIGASDANGKLVLLSNSITNADDVTATDTMATTTIYGVGQVVLAGGVDSSGNYTRAGSIVNRSALIESGGDMTLSAQTITNTRRTLTMSSTFDQPVSAVDIAALGISLSGQVGQINTPNPNSIGGVYIDPPHGGRMNSDYLYTTYTGTATENGVTNISPMARIVAGGNLGLDAATLQNYWSQIASTGNMNLTTGITIDQNSWRNGASLPQILVAYSGNYVYRTYRGEIWSHSFCDSGCDAPGDDRYYTRTSYDSSLSANGTIAGTGVTLHNGASAAGIVAPNAPSGGSSANTSGSAPIAPTVGPAPNPQTVNLAPSVLPNNGLFHPSTNPSANYLIETNPQFTNRQQWLSSDYLLTALSSDPSTVQKRLGDGYYEQQLIRAQVAQLTGRQFLGDYTSTQDEYAGLMNNAVTVAQQYGLRPGVALTADQVAKLTSDIVWLVPQTVTLPDGSSTTALVPQVYLSAATRANLSRDGALVAANNIDLQDLKGLSNGGTIQAKQNLNLQTQGDLSTTGGSLIAGRQMTLAAGGNVDLNSATLQAGALSLSAGKDVNLQTLTQTVTAANGSRTTLGRVSSIAVSGDTAISTGGDLNQQGAKLSTGGDLSVQTGGNWNLGAVQTNETKSANRFGGTASSYFTQNTGSSLTVGGNTSANVAGDLNVAGSSLQLGSQANNTATLNVGGNVNLAAVKDTGKVDSSWNTGGGSFGSSSKGTYSSYDETVKGSSLNAGGALNVNAGKDVNVSGSQVNAAGAAVVNAGGSVTVSAVEERHSNTLQASGGKSGVVSSRSSQELHSSDSTNQIGSSVGGATVNVNAGQDIAVKGSSVVSDSGTTLTAGRNVNIEAATSTSSRSDYSKTEESGLMSNGGLSVSYGDRSLAQTNATQTTTAVASTVGAVSGNVNITAGQGYTQKGSDVLAPQGDVNIAAKSVNIQETRETTANQQSTAFSQSGVTASLTSTVVSAGQAIQSMSQAAGQTSSDRMKALAGAAAALNVKNAANAVQTGQGGNLADQVGGVSLNVSVGSSSSNSQSTGNSDTARGSTVNAGGNVNIKATGAGKDSNLTVQGSDVKAGGTTTLQADNQVNLLAAQNTASQTSSSDSHSASVGVAINLGSKAGIGVTGSMSKGSGSGNGSDVSYTNTHVSGDNVSIASGGDTTLKGATVTGNTVTANVGGNLNIASLQDTSTYQSQSSSTGVSVTVPVGIGSYGGSISKSETNINSDYKSVTEQSAIRAGDGGFRVNVNKDTTLTGGAITSTQVAVDNNKNNFQTGGKLTTSDLQNNASYDASAYSATVGVSGAGQQSAIPISGAGVGKDSGSASSTTVAGISGIAGNTSVRTGDKEAGIQKIFDATKVSNEINAQVKITGEFGKQASKAVADYSAAQTKALQEQLKAATNNDDKAAIQKQLDDVKMETRALNILVGAVAGLGETAVTKEGLAAAADEMRQLMVADSKKFKGVVDSQGNVLSNDKSGLSEGVNGDGKKVGGTRVDLDLLCGSGNERCKTYTDANGVKQLELKDGQVQFDAKDANGKSISLNDFLASPDGQKMSGLTGGVQGAQGTLFGIPYAAGSWQDKLVEAFAGSHDMIGGKLTGLYDDQGNIKRGMSETEQAVYNKIVTTSAILPSIPFAAAQGLSPEVWKAISVLLGGAK